MAIPNYIATGTIDSRRIAKNTNYEIVRSDRNVENGSAALHRALWKHHPRIMHALGANPVMP